MSNLIQSLHELAEKHNISIEEMKWKMENEAVKERDEKIREKVSENSDLAGKCFVRKTSPRNGMYPEIIRLSLPALKMNTE